MQCESWDEQGMNRIWVEGTPGRFNTVLKGKMSVLLFRDPAIKWELDYEDCTDGIRIKYLPHPYILILSRCCIRLIRDTQLWHHRPPGGAIGCIPTPLEFRLDDEVMQGQANPDPHDSPSPCHLILDVGAQLLQGLPLTFVASSGPNCQRSSGSSNRGTIPFFSTEIQLPVYHPLPGVNHTVLR